MAGNAVGDAARLFLQNQPISISVNKKPLNGLPSQEGVGPRLTRLVVASFGVVTVRLRHADAGPREGGTVAQLATMLCSCTGKAAADSVSWCEAFCVAGVHKSIYTALSSDSGGALSLETLKVMLDATSRLIQRAPAKFTAFGPLASLIFYGAVERHSPEIWKPHAHIIFWYILSHFLLASEKADQLKEIELAFDIDKKSFIEVCACGVCARDFVEALFLHRVTFLYFCASVFSSQYGEALIATVMRTRIRAGATARQAGHFSTIRSSEVPTDRDLPKCAKCGCSESSTKPFLKKCARYRMVWYCSAECQKASWCTHKPVCVAVS